MTIAAASQTLTASPAREAGARHCTVLLALCNGADRLDTQLATISAQTHRDWSLIVSDDGSTDGGPQKVRDFAAAHPNRDITLLDGPKLGFAQNFLHLIRAAGPHTRFAALSDQDDSWLPQKLSRAIATLRDVPKGRPAVYCGRTTICNESLRPLRNSPRFRLPPSFRNALVQSIAGGNTMVLNRAALDILQEASPRVHTIVAHDWWIYQIITGAGGVVLYDRTPMVLYRQHGGNLIGANDTIFASLSRIARLFRGHYRDWNAGNAEALDAARHWLEPEARAVLDEFERARNGTFTERLVALRRSGVYRQTRRGNLALVIAALTRRL